MNGRKAKKIRKAVYGEMSLSQPRRYKGAEARKGFLSFKNVGLRAAYLEAKKRHRRAVPDLPAMRDARRAGGRAALHSLT